MIRAKILIILLFLTLAPRLAAQRVGLVLSGGGAKGLYHIGVIMALEDNGIPIDYISGTSMGAIIGGMYASGMSPRQMCDDFFYSPQVKYWLTGEIEGKYRYYFKQMRKNASMLSLRLDFRNPSGIARMPSNLVPTNQLDMAFVETFAPATVACGGDFDRLFVPFRCIATEAVKREGVVFRNGDLGKAIRTSMSIPLVFRPVRTDSTLFYDGGIINNFPWQILEEDFQPDVIIGSKCVEGKEMPDENSLMDQVFNLAMMHTDYSLPEGKGIMISRVFDDVSILEFEKARVVVKRGYDDAMKQMPLIRERISRRVAPEEVQRRRIEFRRDCPPLVFDSYRITGLNPHQQDYVRRVLKLDRADRLGTMYSFNQFRTEYFKILSEGQIDGDYPDVVYNDSTRCFELSMRMKTKPSVRLLFGGNVSSTALNQAYVGLEVKRIGRTAQCYNIDSYLSPFYLSAAANSRIDFFAGIPMYAEAGFVGNYYNYFRSNYGFLSKGNDLTYSKYHDSYFTLAYGLPVDRHSVLSFRGNFGRDTYRYFQSIGYADDDVLDRTRFDFFGTSIEMERNSLNYIMYPTEGIYQSMSMIFVSGKEFYTPGASGWDLGQTAGQQERHWFGARFSRTNYLPIRPIEWFSCGYMVEAVLTSHPGLGNDYASNISSPAFTPTPHSKIVYMKEFRSPSYLAVGLMPIVRFTPNFYLKMNAYAFLPKDYDKVTEGIRQRLRYIFDASLVYQSFIGPVSLSVSKYDVKRNNWFLTFNFGYAIFNRKGIFY